MSKIFVPMALLCASAALAAPGDREILASANKAVQLMEKSMGGLVPNIPCASCHHNNMPLWAFSVARDHGVTVNADLNRRVAVKTYSFLQDVDRAIQGTTFVDPALEGGELLAFAGSVGVKPGLTTALEVRRMAGLQREDGHWATFDSRPPQSSSLFMTTALNIKALQDYMPTALQEERDRRIASARQWLLDHEPLSVEDGAFRLLGLQWSGASREELQSAAGYLAGLQAEDGSWAQAPGRVPDAYGTGEALTALKMTDSISDEAYRRGLAWLIRNQQADGSWLVKSRLHEVAPISPPYMETGFPHGRNQIVSMIGTTWSVMALSLALPEHRVDRPDLREVQATAEPWIETAAFGNVEQVEKLDVNLHTPAGSTILMVVANDPDKVAALIGRDVDVKQRAKSGHTALSVAASYNHAAPVLRQLVEKGADAVPVKGVEFNSSPLVYATYAGDLEAVRILLDHGANLTQTMLLAGLVPMNPVSAAIHFDDADILREYLKRGADPNMVDQIPILSLAALANRPHVTKVLIEAGADPGRKDKFGWTPIQHARSIEHDKNEVAELIETANHGQTQNLAEAASPQE